ncbi:conserved oligomeric Golgi complex component [Podila epigama]|nr:conserved oligomeric Golgi complex component [Podila epigama]
MTSTEHATNSDQDVLFDLILQQVPTPKREMLSTTWSKDYLNRLTSLPARALHNEPSKLREEQLKVERDMSALAFKDYKTFILVKDCKDEVQSTFETLGQHLDHFHETIPEFNKSLTTFSSNVADILQKQHVYNSILASHSQLLEVLEIPVLMETCVRNSYYHEALELAAHVQRLVLRYPRLKIIQEIEAKVSQNKEMMLVQLLAQLREPIKLPAALRIISFLRRIGSFSQQLYIVEDEEQQVVDRDSASLSSTSSKSTTTTPPFGASFSHLGAHTGTSAEDETQLRMLFLKSRGLYMNQQLAKIILHKGDSFGYLKKYIDVTRECLFDIMTYYKSIFGSSLSGGDAFTGGNSSTFIGNGSSHLGSTARRDGTRANGNGLTDSSMDSGQRLRAQRQHCWSVETLLADFVTYRTQILLQVLHTHIPEIHDTQALSSILTQLMYLGANMGKIGFDLRYLVTSLFEDAVIRIVGGAFQRGASEFMDSLGGEGFSYPEWQLPSQWMLGGTGRLPSSTSGSPTLSRAGATGGGTGTGTAGSPTTLSSSSSSPLLSGNSSSMSPQTVLMDYPALAYLTNAYLTALNSLRLLAPLAVAVPLREILVESLTLVNTALDEYDRFVFGERANSTVRSVLKIGQDVEGSTQGKTPRVQGLAGSVILNEQKTMDGFVIVYKRAVYDYILKCFDEGIYSGLARELYDTKDDDDETEGKVEAEDDAKTEAEGDAKAEAEDADDKAEAEVGDSGDKADARTTNESQSDKGTQDHTEQDAKNANEEQNTTIASEPTMKDAPQVTGAPLGQQTLDEVKETQDA